MDETDDVVMEPEDGEGNTKNPEQKLKELREKLLETQKQRDEYLDSLQRMKADYINARKRFEEESKSLTRFATEGLVMQLLPVMDGLESALQHFDGESGSAEGIKNIKNELLKIFSQNGVEAFDPTGAPFDPMVHEPVETVAVKSEKEDNTVTKVHQKGYTLNGRLIRPARVAVGHYQK